MIPACIGFYQSKFFTVSNMQMVDIVGRTLII